VTIAERLERLFAETAGPHGRPVTLQEIIQRMEQRGISSMSLSYLQQLRKGEAQNPRLQHLRALADAFGVPVSYFLEDDDSSTAEDRELPERRSAVQYPRHRRTCAEERAARRPDQGPRPGLIPLVPRGGSPWPAQHPAGALYVSGMFSTGVA
jgi:transcriptional regulator with XRE-family HTH domain